MIVGKLIPAGTGCITQIRRERAIQQAEKQANLATADIQPYSYSSPAPN